MQVSSAISFRLLPGSISAAASSGSPLLSGFSGLNFFPLSLLSVDFLTPAVSAFFRPLQFWVLTTQPLFLPFRLIPVSASQWLPRFDLSALASLSFPLFFRLISHASDPVLRTRLSARFLSSFPVSLPQPFHWCLPYAPLRFLRFAFGHFPSFPLSFVRFFSGSDYSAFVFSFPFFPDFPSPGLPGAYFRFPSRLFPCVPFHFRYSALLHFLSPLFCFATQVLLQLPTSCFQHGRSP